MQHSMGGIAFEVEVQDRFRSLGWRVERTPVTGDYGADLVARLDGEIVVVQCKDYGSPAGVRAVQEVHFAKAHYGATAAVAVARNGFTRAAIKAAEATGVQILRPTDIAAGSSLDRTLRQREIEQQEANRRRAEARRRREIEEQDTVMRLSSRKQDAVAR
ncbi:MAG: restriction endonuclease [Rhodopila sp.]